MKNLTNQDEQVMKVTELAKLWNIPSKVLHSKIGKNYINYYDYIYLKKVFSQNKIKGEI